MPFVPDQFEPPGPLSTNGFRLEPLGPEHNEDDYEAWTSSVEHIRATPGFEGRSWPRPMTIEQNGEDLLRHAEDFTARTGFTYTVLDPDGGVIGCVYLYPSQDQEADVEVLSWVRASHAHLDRELWVSVSAWLADGWPFTRVRYARRDS